MLNAIKINNYRNVNNKFIIFVYDYRTIEVKFKPSNLLSSFLEKPSYILLQTGCYRLIIPYTWTIGNLIVSRTE